MKYAIGQTIFCPSSTLLEQSTSSGNPSSVLSILPGDRLIVYAEKDGWCHGSLYGSKSEPGVFPANAVAFIRKSETNLNEGTNLFDEISQATQDWWCFIKEGYGKKEDLGKMEQLLEYIDDLINIRKKILSGDVPAEELNEIRSQVGQKIDRGNALSSLPVVIRQENGRPFRDESISLLQTFKEHQASAKRALVQKVSDKHMKGPFSVLFTIHSIELKLVKYNCEVSFIIYDVLKKTFVSEPFSFIWKPGDSMKDLNIRALLSSFSTEEDKSRFYLLSRIAQVAPIEGASSTLKKGQDLGPVSLYSRQIYAYDFLELSWLLEKQTESNGQVDRILYLKRSTDLDNLFKFLQANGKIPRDTTNPDDTKILISTSILKGTADDISHGHSVIYGRKPPLTIHRSDQVSLPRWNTTVRNELFVTLQFGELGSKSSERNIEARLCAVRGNGNIIDNAFESVVSTGEKYSREYRSFVFYHQDKPYWMESVKLKLTDLSLDEIYLRITFHSKKSYDKGKPEKGPFALAHLSLLLNTNIVKNEEHELLVYKIESSTTNYDNSCTDFLSLPQTRQNLCGPNNKPHSTNYSLNEKSVIHVSTNLCSNVFTQNDAIFNILRWRSNLYDLEKSLLILAAPSNEFDEEMLRFMHPLLEALFDIWEERDQLELPVFNVLVAFLVLIREARNTESAVYYEKYLEKFHHVRSAPCLLRCLHHHIVSANTTTNDVVRNSLKRIGDIFELILATKMAIDTFEPNTSSLTDLKPSLVAVLDAIKALMTENRERMVIQNVALKSLPQIINPILKCGLMEPSEICKWILEVVRAFGPNIVARERLGFVGHIIETKLFDKISCRALLLPVCVDLVVTFMNPDICEQKEKEYPEKASECVSILFTLMERLFPGQKKQSDVEYGTDEELNTLISVCYRPSIEALVTVQKILPFDKQNRRTSFFALVLALLNKMSAQIFNQMLQSCVEITDKSDFVREMMEMIRDLLDKCPFDPTWEQMILLQNKTVNKVLRFIMSSIQDNFSDDDYYAVIWEEYMLTSVSFVTQQSLHKNDFWLQDSKDLCFQLRKAAAKDLRSMWFRLKVGQKMEYIPRLVGAFLKVALMEDAETRDATIPIFFDMMQCEFHSSGAGQQNFKQFADELVQQLDYLINEHFGSRQFREHFTRILTNRCQSEKDFWMDGGRQFVKDVDHLIQYLFEYRDVLDSDSCVENAMSRTVQLMNYYKCHNHHELYISYVYRLFELHMTYNNDVEAARTLLLHAENLTWEDEQLPEWLVARNLNSQCATERQLKEELLNRVVDLFTKGQMWEEAIRILRELVPVYEKIFVNYRQLASIWDHMGELCRKIDEGNRLKFLYYFVGFYGKGFPAYLNGKRFVFRSDEFERLLDFKARMEQMYDNPESIPTMDDCFQYESLPGRYMQIFSVEPVSEGCPFDDSDDKINPNIKDYYRHYNVKNFEYSRTETRKNTKWTKVDDSEMLKTWIVKRRILTKDSLPGVLRFSPIVTSTKPYELSPLRRAVDQMKQKNRDLIELATYARYYPESNAQNLQAAILGVIQANVQGGIKNYEVFLLNEECMKIYESDEMALASELSAAIIEQVEILEVCIYAHANQTNISEPLHEHLVESFHDYKQYVDNHFGKTSSRLPSGTSLKRVSQPLQGTVSEKSTSRLLSTSNFMDFATTSGSTLKLRGHTLSSTVLNILSSPVRKTTAGTPTASPLNSSNLCTSETFVPRPESLETLSSRRAHLLSVSSGDMIRIRRASRDTAVPPPLPPRPAHLNGSSGDGSIDRSVLLGDRHVKPPISTPLLE